MRFFISFVAAVLFVAALMLRLQYLEERSVWFDEASSWQTANMPYSELIQSLRQSTHVPLYYPLLQGWMSLFGESPAAIRWLSLLAGLLTAISCGLLASRCWPSPTGWFKSTNGTAPVASVVSVGNHSLSDERPIPNELSKRPSLIHSSGPMEAIWFGVFSFGLCGLSAFQVHTSVEARMYSLGTLLTLCSTWLTLRLAEEGQNRRLWVSLAVVTVTSLYLHHFLILTAISQAAYLACVHRSNRPNLRRCLISVLAVVLLWLPALWLWWEQFNRVKAGFWIPEFSVWTLPRTVFEFVASPPPGVWWEYRYEGIPVLGLFGALLWVGWSAGGWKIRYLIMQSLFPMVVIGGVSFWVPLWEARYFRFAHVTLLICLAAGVWPLARTWRRRTVLATISLALSLSGAVFFWTLRDIPNRQAVRGVCLVIERQDPGDGLPVIVSSPMNYVVTRYYANEFGWPVDRVKLWTGSERQPADAIHLVGSSDWWNPAEFRHQGSLRDVAERSPNLPRAWFVSEPNSWARFGMNFGQVWKFDSDLRISDWSVAVKRLNTSDVSALLLNRR